MDSPALIKKIKQAEKLRKKRGFLLDWFVEPDFHGSGDLFAEIAEEVGDQAEKERLYIEAANTFLMKPEEYSYFRAAEMYGKLCRLCAKSQEIERAVEYGECQGNSLELANRHMMAGQVFLDLGKLCDKGMAKTAQHCYQKAALLFEKDGSCPFHTKKALEQLLCLQLAGKDFVGAKITLGKLDVKQGMLCRQLLSIILENGRVEELDDPVENALVMTLVNKEKEDGLKALEEFSADNFLPDYTQRIVAALSERLQPENDIC